MIWIVFEDGGIPRGVLLGEGYLRLVFGVCVLLRGLVGRRVLGLLWEGLLVS
jgi:hypothetical protein